MVERDGRTIRAGLLTINPGLRAPRCARRRKDVLYPKEFMMGRLPTLTVLAPWSHQGLKHSGRVMSRPTVMWGEHAKRCWIRSGDRRHAGLRCKPRLSISLWDVGGQCAA